MSKLLLLKTIPRGKRGDYFENRLDKNDKKSEKPSLDRGERWAFLLLFRNF